MEFDEGEPFKYAEACIEAGVFAIWFHEAFLLSCNWAFDHACRLHLFPREDGFVYLLLQKEKAFCARLVPLILRRRLRQ